MRLVAIDPSITCTGWALFDVQSERLLGVGKIKPLPPTYTLANRLDNLQSQIKSFLSEIKLTKDDILICESPTSMKDPSAAFKVEQVRCIFEALAREQNIQVPGRINPRTIQYEILGLRGRQLERAIVKELAVGIVERTQKKNLDRIGFSCSTENLKKHQDIVDAILIGSLAISRVKSALASETPVDIYLRSLERIVTRTKFKAA